MYKRRMLDKIRQILYDGIKLFDTDRQIYSAYISQAVRFVPEVLRQEKDQEIAGRDIYGKV